VSKNYAILVFSVVVLALGVVLLALGPSKDTTEVATVSLIPDGDEHLREPLSPSPLANLAASSVPVMAMPSSPPTTHPGTEIIVGNEIHQKLNLTYEEYRSQLDKTFASEIPDLEWSSAATSKLAQDLTSHLPQGSELVDVECRKSMCRVRADNANPDGFVKLSRAIVDMTRDDWTGGMLLTDDSPKESTHRVAVAFLGRSGSPLPDPVVVAR
jgi:hypothetical protein